MTREEAIKYLQDIGMRFVPTDQYGDFDDPQPYDDAIDMAIEALKTSEVISNKDLVINHLIKQLLYVKPDWILADRVLPNIDEEVIVSVCDDSGDNSYYYTTTGWLCHDTWISNNERICGEVIAWAPLPKPYKEV